MSEVYAFFNVDPTAKTEPVFDSPRATSRSEQVKAALIHAARNTPGYILSLDNLLYKGGTAYIFRALCPFTGEERAIKISKDPSNVQQIDKEARIHASLTSNLPKSTCIPHIYPDQKTGSYIHTLGENHFMVMDLIKGRRLSDMIGEDLDDYDMDHCVRLGYRITRSLADIHQADVIHGDVKPDNIMITREGESYGAVILDFGAATLVLDTFTPATTPFHMTIAYAAPEIIQNQQPTIESDMFSAGVLFYELITGVNPRLFFQEGNKKIPIQEVMDALPPIPPLIPHGIITEDLCAIIGKMTELDPEKRYIYVFEAVKELEAYLASVNIVLPENSHLI